jgi:16S rRNA (uracil1498-N3)-methyltransferase
VTLPVFVADLAGATVGALLEVSGAEAHHATKARRLESGDFVSLSDTHGLVAICEVMEVGKTRMAVTVTRLQEVPNAEPQLIVVQAIPKGDRGELAVQMLTEIGVDEIIPWSASRSVAVWRGDRADKSLAKWRRTAFESSKQARRAHFALVREPATSVEVAALLDQADHAFVLHEEATEPLISMPMALAGRIVVVVGPEGGISPEEITMFGAERTRRLGHSVLRTSTAGVAAGAALLAHCGRWS